MKAYITLYIDPATAIRAGNAHIGEVNVEITPKLLRKLTEDQRDTLARHIAGEVDWKDRLTKYAPPIAEYRSDVLAGLLDRRRALILGCTPPDESYVDYDGEGLVP